MEFFEFMHIKREVTEEIIRYYLQGRSVEQIHWMIDLDFNFDEINGIIDHYNSCYV